MIIINAIYELLLQNILLKILFKINHIFKKVNCYNYKIMENFHNIMYLVFLNLELIKFIMSS